jgi:Fe-S-cluster-containing dehydrogenase component/formate-dependent nitrite reductase membrane component NrfD
MKFGFVIDNRKCIGCHACTVACKSEHDVPVGVNRTWVKQTEKGTFPNTRRIFQVSRCNHCTDAPCVSICPTEALHTREDGIVDFNNDRCIGCKSCMQACPYDALYIDPETNTAAKCNYCAHRTDIGLEPACVNVCPEHAIISGDMEDPNTEISQLLAREQVKVRKPEKGTKPNVFYIDGDEASLNPTATERSHEYMWGTQTSGVGHYAKYAEQKAEGADLIAMIQELNGHKPSSKEATYGGSNEQETPKKQVEMIMGDANPKRVYDTPDKGILWGWEVSAYVLTKAISAGIFLMVVFGSLLGYQMVETTQYILGGTSLIFLAATGILLIMDLDRPDRFLYVLLRPQWGSWLVKGGYSITVFGGMVTAWLAGIFLEIPILESVGFLGGFASGVMVAIYTAFLFAQAKGRDFWQSPSMVFHMFIHSMMAGAAAMMVFSLFTNVDASWMSLASYVLVGSLIVNVLVMIVELNITHPTEDAKLVVKMILKGRYSNMFWVGVLSLTNLLPIVLLLLGIEALLVPAAILSIIGIYLTEKIWVEAPQRIALS